MKSNVANNINLAILGTRGIPASYGGFETFVEELSTRLAPKGYDISVYCRRGYALRDEPIYKGVRLIFFNELKNKYLETVGHTFFSTLHELFSKNKIVYFCNPINSIFLILPRLFGKITVINVDGLEWKRKKWNAAGKFAFKLSERIATWFAHHIITDSKGIQSYYKERYNKDTVFISYGAEIPDYIEAGETMRRLGLKKRNYILYISRLEPENNAHLLIKAYEKVKGDMPLIIVGDAPYAKKYIRELRSTADKRIRFAGSIYGKGCWELRCNAFLYIHGNEAGGTNPGLLEAMASGNCVIANGVSFNKEVVADAGICFEPGNIDDLRGKIQNFLEHPEATEEYRIKAKERVRKCYNWDDVAAQYDVFFKKIISNHKTQ